MADLLTIYLHEDPRKSSVKTSNGTTLAGVTNVMVRQEANEPPKAALSVELFSLCAYVYADQCVGTLDPDTVDVLERLPARVLASLARQMQGLAEDAAEAEQRVKARLNQKKPDNAGESL